MNKVYVAGSYADRENIRKMIELLEFNRFEITENWTWHESVEEEKKEEYAKRDFRGVAQCDVFILVIPPKASPGKYTELGMALAWNKFIIAIGNPGDSLFHTLIPDENFALHIHDAIYKIRKARGEYGH